MCLLSMALAQLSSAQGRARLSLPQHQEEWGDGGGRDKFHLSARAMRSVLGRTGWRVRDGAKGRHRDECSRPRAESTRVNQAIAPSSPRQPCPAWGHHPSVPQPSGTTEPVRLQKAFETIESKCSISGAKATPCPCSHIPWAYSPPGIGR